MKKGVKTFLFVVNLILGLYLVNSVLLFAKLPEALLKVNNGVLIICGVLLIVNSFLILKIKRYVY